MVNPAKSLRLSFPPIRQIFIFSNFFLGGLGNGGFVNIYIHGFLELFGRVEESNGTVPIEGLQIRDECRR